MLSSNFDLYVSPGHMPPVLRMAQYDSGREFVAYLRKEDYSAFTPGTGATAKIKGRNARGVCWEQEATIAGSTVEFTPSGAATDQFGVMPVSMEITVDDETISTLLMVWDIQRAGYTSEEAVTSPEFETALEEAVAAAIAQQGLGFTEEFKQALLACLNNVAWATPDGQSLVEALEDALYPEVHLTSITADYEQDRPILDTDSLDLVRLDLVVTANYSDGTSETLADDAYTLTGTLTVGTSTITVGYQGKTDTIEVVVTEKWSYSIADLTKVNGPLGSSVSATCGMYLDTEETNPRRSFVVGQGATSIALGTSSSTITAQTSDYYPIKVPAGATKVTLTPTPATQYVQCLARSLTGGVYSTLSSSGWSGYQAGGGTKTFAAPAGDNAYIFVTLKYDSAGTSYPSEPTGMDIVFSDQ